MLCRIGIGNLWNRRPFLFFRKRQAVCAEDQEGMNYDGTPVKAPPASRRKIMPTPQQSSYSSIETVQWQTEVEDQESGSFEKEFEGQHRRNARDRTVIGRMEQYLNESDCMKLELKGWSFRLVQKIQKFIDAYLEVCEQERR